MNNRINLFAILAILILPVLLYSYLKAPSDSNGITMAATGTPVVMKFSSPMCHDCKKLDKVLKTVTPKYQGKITFQKYNAQSGSADVQSKIKKYNVNVVPTLIYLDKNGKYVKKTEGSMPAQELQRNLDGLLNG